MKIIRTANLSKLKTCILGGQIDQSGNYCEADQSFTEYDEGLKTEGEFDLKKIKNAIIFYVEEYGNEPFDYYGEIYKFKMPSEKNLDILAKDLLKTLKGFEKE